MSQAYSDPKRESDPYALPDIEVWRVVAGTPYDKCPLCREANSGDPGPANEWREFKTHYVEHTGWYWQSCFPGCLPDGDPVGPFATEAEALADAQEGMGD